MNPEDSLAVGDLVTYGRHTICGPVKGRVTAVFNDVVGWTVTLVVTSRSHVLYQAGTELVVLLSDPTLKRRKRYRV